MGVLAPPWSPFLRHLTGVVGAQRVDPPSVVAHGRIDEEWAAAAACIPTDQAEALCIGGGRPEAPLLLVAVVGDAAPQLQFRCESCAALHSSIFRKLRMNE